MASIASLFTRRSRGTSRLNKPFHEPHVRKHHCAVPLGDKLYTWGGIPSDSLLASVVDIYDPFLEKWESHSTTGTAPPPIYGAACASALDSLYSFGGNSTWWSNSLYRLDTTSLCWNEVEIKNASQAPLPKENCGMLTYQDDKLVLFGGYGTALKGNNEQRKRVLEDRDGSVYRYTGWLNELNVFNLKGGYWTSPLCSRRPTPCSGFSFTSIGPKRAVLFGGRTYSRSHWSHGSHEETYIFDLQQTQWSPISKQGNWPKARWYHAACCLNYGEEHPQLLISGGERSNEVLQDCWILNVDSGNWEEIPLPDEVPSRVGHTVTAFRLAPGLTEVTMFGGQIRRSSVGAAAPPVSETTVLHFEYDERPTSWVPKWVLMGVARSAQLGSLERVREKMVRMHQKNIESMDQALIEIHTKEQDLQGRVEAAEQKMQRAEWRAESRGATNSRVLTEKQGRVDRAAKQAEELEHQLAQSQKAAQEVAERAKEAELKAQDAEQKAAEVERRVHSRTKEQPFWVVKRSEFQLTGERLGDDTQSNLQVATFRGIRVAAKRLRDLAQSECNQATFVREMNVAAQIHHPNLLQFLGATLEEEPIILTELMPTSLRALLWRETLSHQQTISIGLDVAQAINYLHLMRPDPIIHHNLHSTTVFIERGANDTCKAKITNIREKMSTTGPYAAPEAKSPFLWSIKMDIFSLGILLVELSTGQLPDANALEHLIQSIAEPQIAELIRDCTAENKDSRPPAAEIIERLSGLRT